MVKVRELGRAGVGAAHSQLEEAPARFGCAIVSGREEDAASSLVGRAVVLRLRSTQKQECEVGQRAMRGARRRRTKRRRSCCFQQTWLTTARGMFSFNTAPQFPQTSALKASSSRMFCEPALWKAHHHRSVPSW